MGRHRDEGATLLERAAHDLLNPVASILGLSETIRSQGAAIDDETLRRIGESIARQAGRLERAIRDLVRAAELLRSGPAVALEPVRLASALTSISGGRVRADLDPAVEARADRDLLADVVQRLVDNALEHSTAEVFLSAGSDAGVAWIEVADRGPGFTREGLERAFEPLSAGANVAQERGGLGLGLFIARRLVEAMGGTLTGRSRPGEGSVFRVELRR